MLLPHPAIIAHHPSSPSRALFSRSRSCIWIPANLTSRRGRRGAAEGRAFGAGPPPPRPDSRARVHLRRGLVVPGLFLEVLLELRQDIERRRGGGGRGRRQRELLLLQCRQGRDEGAQFLEPREQKEIDTTRVKRKFLKHVVPHGSIEPGESSSLHTEESGSHLPASSPI
jgi:hypothetical protein